MAFQFPPNPIIGQEYTPSAGITYRWSGLAWFLVNNQFLTYEALLAAFPIGSIFITATNINPGASLGGTWSQIMQGRFPVGVDGATYPQGGTGGEAAHALVEAENGTHTHSVSDPSHLHGVTDPGHVHGIPSFATAGAGGVSVGVQSGAQNTGAGFTGVTVLGAGTGISIVGSGASTPHENRPPYLAIYFWQRTG